MIKITNIFIILFLTLIGFFLKAKSPEEMIKESIANYPGKCPCPYSIMSNGQKCGKRSAYSNFVVFCAIHCTHQVNPS